MYSIKRRVIFLTEDDGIIMELGFHEGRTLADVTVALRARIGGSWVEVGRYDNAHGFPHVHRFWSEAPQVRLAETTSPTALATRGKQDFLENWQRYRRLMEARLR